MSTYIRRPPYWEGGAWRVSARLKGMRPLAILPDNITTDHLSPSNAILARLGSRRVPGEDGPAGGGLQLLRHPPRRSPDRPARHLRQPHSWSTRWRWWTAQVKKGSLARVEPEGQVMRMWEAIETYMNRKQPLIIVAGADYGQGSSR